MLREQAVQQLIVVQKRPDSGEENPFFDLEVAEKLDLGQPRHLAGEFQRLFPTGVGFQTPIDEHRDRESVLVLVGKWNQARIPVQGTGGA